LATAMLTQVACQGQTPCNPMRNMGLAFARRRKLARDRTSVSVTGRSCRPFALSPDGLQRQAIPKTASHDRLFGVDGGSSDSCVGVDSLSQGAGLGEITTHAPDCGDSFARVAFQRSQRAIYSSDPECAQSPTSLPEIRSSTPIMVPATTDLSRIVPSKPETLVRNMPSTTSGTWRVQFSRNVTTPPRRSNARLGMDRSDRDEV